MEKETALPKNVRQIGDIQGSKRVYMEDYVATYIHKKEKLEEQAGFLGVFLGELQKTDGETRLFIRGLMDIALDRWDEKTEKDSVQQINSEEKKEKTPDAEQKDKGKKEHGDRKKADKKEETQGFEEVCTEAGESEKLSAARDDAEEEEKAGKRVRRKRTVQEESRDYFDGLEILGCCVIGKYPVEPMKRLVEEAPQSRRFLYHLEEQEEHLYWAETGKYEEISGYFVFYEQNRSMQEYMSAVLSESEEPKEKITDQAIKAFREKIKKKDQIHTAGMLKLASSFFVVTVLVAGAIAVTRTGNNGTVSRDNGSAVKTRMQENGSSGSVTGENAAVSGQDNAADNADVGTVTVSGDYLTADVTGTDGGLTDVTGTDGSPTDAAGTNGSPTDVAGTNGSLTDAAGTNGGLTDGAAGNIAQSADNLTDGMNAGLTDAVAQADSAGAADVQEVISNDAAVQADSAGIAAVQEGSSNAAAAQINSVSAADAQEVISNAAAAQADSVSAGGAQKASADIAAVQADAASAADAQEAASNAAAAQADSVVATDAQTTSSDIAGPQEQELSAENPAELQAASAGNEAAQADVEASAQVRQIRASYVIREGDTLADICEKYYGSINKLEELCQENGIQDADMILPGQKIVLP